ncbi:ATP-dependent RecD-like DNA helicase [Bacillus sp. HMF5848]|uniref:SF1B family DNA helicase RecD2 n=1 Tax=Bacillus sp. HMF5848 TaxID=2495421 RepID=UPI000F78BD70|nr:ATP-dependent RecD-like DNA helicase [Bacillus sp. HMF5848]RSK27970.1 ATP-dependent RecD-like DNA helicase [Bacillus sp. HMF5848]
MEEQGVLHFTEADRPYVKGSLIATIFHNEENLFSVVRIQIDDTNTTYKEKDIVINGYFPRLHDGEVYIFAGDLKDHPRFGLQFQAANFRKEKPQTKEGLVQYLSSDLFEGIGKKTAQSIVKTLGDNAISKILEDKEVLKQVPNLSRDRANKLYTTLSEHEGLEQIMIHLAKYGFGPQLSMKIYQAYKDQTLQIIQDNPYQLVEDVDGIGFSRADELGHQLGISGNHPDRIKAGCLYIIENASMQEGHVYILIENALSNIYDLLCKNNSESIEFKDISREMIHLHEEGKLVIEDQKVYLPSLYYSEKGFVSNIKRVLDQTDFQDAFPESEFLLALGSLEERLNVQYAPSQKEAIETALMSPMLILTGGPGTGKTTVIKGIVELYAELHGLSLNHKDYKKEEGFPILLVAPTGRAAKRMSESTGLPAHTIHRLLGWNGVDGFTYNEDQLLNGKLLIVDEFSMVDIWLANQLMKALPEQIQVVFVGDEDQLPSVGPGQVLKDLLEAKVVPTVRLTDIYRQAEGSSIIDLAHDIKNGKVPRNLREQKQDRSFINCSTSQVLDVVRKVAQNAKQKGFTAKDIQVLAPMYRGAAGIDAINEALQELFNGKTETKREINFGEKVFRTGDKVLQLVNLPEENVFNGDIGEIVSIFYAKENQEKKDLVIISYDGNEVQYEKQDLGQITLAYCCSVHKAQGSEFPIVILPIVKSYFRMLRRNLIYTAITRSKKFLILCGEEEAFRRGIEFEDDTKRQTTLSEKLKITLNNHKQEAKLEQIPKPNSHDIKDVLPELPCEDDMADISPYDFMEDNKS